ncbi:uncharacterized protein BP5553_00851 [Venustampulla echinocandica]|uniref:Uncharacterized protein n=1 Tax=Venustampulla echinocandica TaxID=2656787 RepID=A0A370TZB7_9HELO|nr:uncharacterized protein BP5553_00851 [Venustampulla echinocandica]RDL40872.1 hypothetical protein BP5553_00851 [Venustampulla echinocandica]
MPPDSSSKEQQFITIHPDADLEVRLYTTKDDNANTTFKEAGKGDKMIRGRIVATLNVSRKVLIENSSTLKAMLSSSFKSRIKISSIWRTTVYALSVPEIYAVIERSHYYFFHLEKLEHWFAKWFVVNKAKIKQMGVNKITPIRGMNELELLVYPCRQFDFASGFIMITRRLAYANKGHISLYNHNPKSRHLQLSPRIVGGINGARANLAHKIHEGAWPLMSKIRGVDQMSVSEILYALLDFDYEAPDDACSYCSRDFLDDVMKVRDDVKELFGGLCLDCIKSPMRKDKAPLLYGEDRRRIWDKGCRERHSQPTWWFSWLSSDQFADVHDRERDERKRLAAEARRKKSGSGTY